jgi:hypothetical protein
VAVNSLLLALKLQSSNDQNEKNGSSTSISKSYVQGIDIHMNKSGLLNDGKVELERDLQPYLDDMKNDWKLKIEARN